MYDLAVIGAGWAGYNAALKAKELGLKVCILEQDKIGGCCLNYGCIPTKTLIQSAKIFHLVKKSSSFGIESGKPLVNFKKIQERKNQVVALLTQGMQGRLKGIEFIKSSAKIISPNRIEADNFKIETKYILIASGARPVELPELKFQGSILSSNDALLLNEIPQSLLVIGGGFIGCEFASLFSGLGSAVTIAEKLPQLLPGQDREISKKLEAIFSKKGIKVITGADLLKLNLDDYSRVIVSVGRQANISGLGLEKSGIEISDGRIFVDDYLRTSIDNIYAAGDCASKIMLAHYAAYQGVWAVRNIVSGNKNKADNSIVPACIFTEPQISSVGLNEDSALKAGLKIQSHKFDFRALAMAQVMDEAEGFIKVISSKDSQEILGASIIGPLASELIAIPAIAMSSRLKIEQLRSTIFAHPTLSESIHEVIS